MLGGIHRTFMYRQVLNEAPWVDAIALGTEAAAQLELDRFLKETTIAQN